MARNLGGILLQCVIGTVDVRTCTKKKLNWVGRPLAKLLCR
jgi:hypothetical protein